MAKRFNNDKNDKKLERTIRRNWIIMGVTLAAIIILFIVSANGGGA